MIKNVEAVAPEDFAELEALWEASVRATHYFLTEADIQAYKSVFPAFLTSLNLFCIKSGNRVSGFIGTSGRKVEVLFVHPEMRSKGIGKSLMKFAVEELAIDQVDVNEQNTAALAFYLHLGFGIAGRSERDGMNKPYPLLHLQLPQE